MSDVNLYDNLNYDNWPTTTSQNEYDLWDFWVNFQNGFKIPTTFVKNLMFKYLTPISTTYKTTRKTKAEINAYNLQKTSWGITLTWTIIWSNRAELMENIEHFKIKCRNRQNIVIKDWWVERVYKCITENISFDENHYNKTFMKFEVSLSFRDYWAYNENTNLQYLWKSWAVETMWFYNNWLETDFIWVIEINSWTNIDLILNINWVDLEIDWVSSWDTIHIDTEEVSVKINWSEIVFWWILNKLEEWENVLTITRNWSCNYDFNIFYKKTIS